MKCFTILVLLLPFALVSGLNNRPIIGVLTEEVYHHNDTTQIYASYVKYLESAGARVVPIWVFKPQEYYEDLLMKINGVLFPGGRDILRSEGYGRAGRIIFNIAKKLNEQGDFFPLWGTCLGFELLNFLTVNKLWMKSCLAEDLPSNINLVDGFESSKMFRDLSTPMYSTMKNNDVAIHYHRWCITPQNFSLSGLNKYFKVLAVNQDWENTTFVSAIEAYKYPFYGVAFHPEKLPFEWAVKKSYKNVPHTAEAIQVSQYFGNFFVNEARNSNHTFPTVEMEREKVIYNYNPTYTGKEEKKSTEQTYFFNDKTIPKCNL